MRSRALVLTVCGGLLVGLLSSAGLVSESAVAAEPGSAVGSVPSQPHAQVPAQEVEGSQEPPAAPVWPTAASASVDLSSVPAGEAVAVTPSGEVVDAGGSAAEGAALVLAPVAETAAEGEVSPSGSPPLPERVDVAVLDRSSVASAGVGLEVRLTRSDGSADTGSVRISLDYSGFRYAYGGSFASRLRLVRVPGCALTTPEADGCGVREFVEADNDTSAGVLTAVVQADPDPAAVPAGDGGASTQLAAPSAAAAGGSGGTVYALASGSSSDAGDYRASPLGQTGSWDVSPGSGAFSYSVPVQVPEPPVGAAPSLALGYNAQSVDGRTSASNNQASWAGMGWDLNVGFIERRYRNCTQDGLPTIGDLCWDSPNTGMEPDGQVLVINLGGMTSQLVQDNDGAGSYHVLDDPGWRVQHLFGGHGGDDEYWVLSHQDGMRYYFGWGRSERTNATTGSVWTVPVVGNNVGEPCHGQFPEPCTQAWRWSLDRVVDGNEVETAYFYNREFNHYRSVANTDQARQYISGGYLKRIEYGWAHQIAGAQLPAKVELRHVNRCAERMGEANPLDSEPAPCPSIDSSPSSYPDVPLDLRCDGTAADYHCAGKTYYPTFFVEDMLWDIKTFVRDTDAAAWDLVMQYQMKYSLTNPPGVVDGTLWLDYVQRKGYGSGPDITLPVINFNGEYRDNQVGPAELNFRRIISIYGDLGSKTSITYGAPDACSIDALPSQSSNTKNCFWQKWTPEGETEAKTGWFKKFLVSQVTVDPRVGVGAGSDGAPTMTTTYTYIGSPAWRFTHDPLTPDADESWTVWRGYKEAVVTTGTGANTASTHHWLFRGLDGDRTSKTDPSATRSVSVTDTDGVAWTDHAWLAGKTLETSARDEAGSSHERVFHKYWWHNTAQYVGLPDARFVREDETVTRTRISTSTSDDATWREHVIQQEYDSANAVSTTYGLPLRIDDWGQSAVGDNRCTTFGRAYNTDYYSVGGVQRWTVLDDEARHYTVGCADRAAANQDAYAATFYDGATSIAANAPVDGNPTEQREYTSDSAHRSAKASYDAAGRTTGSWDGKGNKTATAYSPATSWPLGGVTVTGPDPDGAGPGTAMAVTTWSSRLWAAPWKIVDANGNTTRVDQDAVGRTAKVWKPTEVAAHPTGDASLTFTYTIPTATTSGVPDSVSGPPQVTSNTLQSGSTYLTSHAYADGLGRAREAQVTAPSGTGRTVTATRYDTSGNVTGTSAGFFNSSTAGSGMVLPAVADLPSYTDLLIDWAGRTTESKIMVNGVNQTAGRVQTAYHHDYTTVTPAVGGATDTHTDVYGQTSKIVEHHGSATYTTSYAYTGSGHLQTITDDLGNTTGYTYNWAGDRLTSDDPDAGTSSTTYDANGNTATSTDAGGTTLTTTYDNLDRALTLKAGTTTLTSRTWDTAPGGKGQPATATAHIDGHDYTTATTGYDTRGRPTGTTVTIPAAETGLAGSYTTSYHYDAADHLTATDHPAAGGLPAETVTATHTPQGHPATLTSGLATYVDATTFDQLGRLTARTYGTTATGQTATRAYTYNDTNGTGWLNNITATATTAGTPQTVQDDTYTRNNRGDITALRENQAAQQQCYTYDDLRRLTAAWTTAATTCPATPGTDFTGPDPYQTTYALRPHRQPPSGHRHHHRRIHHP